MRTIWLAVCLLLVVALPAWSATVSGKDGQLENTYRVALGDGESFKPRDVVTVRRGQRKLGEAMVMAVHGRVAYAVAMSLPTAPRAGDQVSLARHADLPVYEDETPPPAPKGEYPQTAVQPEQPSAPASEPSGGGGGGYGGYGGYGYYGYGYRGYGYRNPYAYYYNSNNPALPPQFRHKGNRPQFRSTQSSIPGIPTTPVFSTQIGPQPTYPTQPVFSSAPHHAAPPVSHSGGGGHR